MRTWSLRVLRQFLHLALSALCVLATAAAGTFKSRAALQVENLALRHQLGVLRRSVKRPKLSPADRFLWVWLCQVWSDWRSSLVVVKPETVVAWHRKGFQLFWTWKVRHGQPGRPTVPKCVRELIRRMSRDNPLWGAPRIHGELLKLGIDVGETSVGKYRVRHRKPPSQTSRTFLENHLKTLVSVDFFTVADDPVPDPVCLLGAGSRPTPDSPLRRHGASDGGVDCPATPRRISLGQRATLSAAGSRSDLRRRIHETSQGYGHQGSPFCPAISLAASVRRTPDRHPPP